MSCCQKNNKQGDEAEQIKSKESTINNIAENVSEKDSLEEDNLDTPDLKKEESSHDTSEDSPKGCCGHCS